jgi:cardiolipin synthase
MFRVPPSQGRNSRSRGQPAPALNREDRIRTLVVMHHFIKWSATWLCLAGVTIACASVNAHQKLPKVELAEASFYPTLEAYAAAPILPGNDVRILLNGEQIFPAIIQAIRSARASITYAQYFFEEGPVADDIVAALAERCGAGVPAHVLLDGVGTVGMPVRHIDALKAAGCDVRTFRALRPWALRRANNRNHRRILVVDGRVGITGGSGVSAKWMGDGRTEDHWRDTDLRIEGPAVEWLQAAFVENWLETAKQALGGAAYFPRPKPVTGPVLAQVVRSSPGGGSFAMYSTFLIALNSARRSIRITNPYFLLDDTMRDAILNRRQRGVIVEVLVPGTIDHKFVRQASRATWGPLLKAGVKMFEYRPALLHAKTVVIDGTWTTVGSTNLDNRSFAMNEEVNVVVFDRGIGQRFEEIFAADLRHARPITYEDWQRRGITARFFELVVAPLRDLL